MILTSKEFYDSFSSNYLDYSKQRKYYLQKIDQLLFEIGKGAISMIDIGCGYGDRSCRLARSLGIKKVTLVDNSFLMLQHCFSERNEQIISDITSRDFIINKKYDMVLCLWNVLGHIDTREKRIIALKNMKNLLTENGKLCIDVNNRYNISEYGVFSVIKNICKDIFISVNETGNFLLKVKNNNVILQTRVHIFTVHEMISLFKKSGLKVVQRKVINYQNGEEKSFLFQGQLFFILSKT